MEPNPSVELVVALGATSYRVERPFFADSGSGGVVSDVAAGPDGLLHVLVRHDSLVAAGEYAIATVDRDGRVLAKWGGDLILDAHMLSVSPDGRLFVVDRDSHEVVICRDRQRIGGLGRRHHPLSPFNHPTCVAFCPAGTIYVSDGYANSRVHRFAADGRLLHSWGELGSGPGQFVTPHAIWVCSNGRVVVADRENDRLQIFSPDGECLAIIGGFVKPLDIWGDALDNLYVTDLVPSLTLLNAQGERIGRCRPVLNGAHGITGDAYGNLYLAEPSPSRVTRLAPLPMTLPSEAPSA
jgi:peptidylglycine monooxygenase